MKGTKTLIVCCAVLSIIIIIVIIVIVRSVAGDMGSYMGLLIGASIVTVFELLDLLIYTFCTKYCRWSLMRTPPPRGPWGLMELLGFY